MGRGMYKGRCGHKICGECCSLLSSFYKLEKKSVAKTIGMPPSSESYT